MNNKALKRLSEAYNDLDPVKKNYVRKLLESSYNELTNEEKQIVTQIADELKDED